MHRRPTSDRQPPQDLAAEQSVNLAYQAQEDARVKAVVPVKRLLWESVSDKAEDGAIRLTIAIARPTHVRTVVGPRMS